jgi:hypothetical protein
MRRITERQFKNNDHELMQVVVIWEEGLRKKDVQSKYSQEHSFLVKRRNKLKLIREEA